MAKININEISKLQSELSIFCFWLKEQIQYNGYIKKYTLEKYLKCLEELTHLVHRLVDQFGNRNNPVTPTEIVNSIARALVPYAVKIETPTADLESMGTIPDFLLPQNYPHHLLSNSLSSKGGIHRALLYLRDRIGALHAKINDDSEPQSQGFESALSILEIMFVIYDAFEADTPSLFIFTLYDINSMNQHLTDHGIVLTLPT